MRSVKSSRVTSNPLDEDFGGSPLDGIIDLPPRHIRSNEPAKPQVTATNEPDQTSELESGEAQSTVAITSSEPEDLPRIRKARIAVAPQTDAGEKAAPAAAEPIAKVTIYIPRELDEAAKDCIVALKSELEWTKSEFFAEATRLYIEKMKRKYNHGQNFRPRRRRQLRTSR